MPNLAMGPVMPQLLQLLGQQAQLAETQVVTQLRQEQLQEAKDNAAQRQRTQQAIMLELSGGPGADTDKGSLPSQDDNPIVAAQKQMRVMQAETAQYTKLAQVARSVGDSDYADKMESIANQKQERYTSLAREMRIEQGNQLKSMAGYAGMAHDDPSFQSAFRNMLREDPDIGKKYEFDRDIDNNPVWVSGGKTERTMDTIKQSGMSQTERDKYNEAKDTFVERAQAAKAKLDKEKADALYADSRAALEGLHLKREEQGLDPKTGLAPVPKKVPATEEEKRQARVDAIADKPPTKIMVEQANNSIQGYLDQTWPGLKFQKQGERDAFAQDVADKANSIRSKNREMDLADARAQAIDELGVFVRQKSTPTGKSTGTLPIGWFGNEEVVEKHLTYNRAGIGIVPTTKDDITEKDGIKVSKNESDRTILKSGLQLEGRGTQDRPYKGVNKQSDYDQLPSGAFFVDPKDGKLYKKP